MGKVSCIVYEGIDLWFWSHDHDPPHFHIKKPGEWEYKVCFMHAKNDILQLVWAETPMKAKFRSKLLSDVANNRATLLREWEAKVSQ